jgi:hypothetical protein
MVTYIEIYNKISILVEGFFDMGNVRSSRFVGRAE